MGDAKYDALLKYDELISVVPMTHDDFLRRESPLFRNDGATTKRTSRLCVSHVPYLASAMTVE